MALGISFYADGEYFSSSFEANQATVENNSTSLAVEYLENPSSSFEANLTTGKSISTSQVVEYLEKTSSSFEANLTTVENNSTSQVVEYLENTSSSFEANLTKVENIPISQGVEYLENTPFLQVFGLFFIFQRNWYDIFVLTGSLGGGVGYEVSWGRTDKIFPKNLEKSTEDL